jgi:hypothetical protein
MLISYACPAMARSLEEISPLQLAKEIRLTLVRYQVTEVDILLKRQYVGPH